MKKYNFLVNFEIDNQFFTFIIMHIISKFLTAFHFYFKPWLKINEDIVNSNFKIYNFWIDSEDIINFTNAIKTDKEEKKYEISKPPLHPLYFSKISWQIISNLNNYLDYKLDQKILNRMIHTSESIILIKKLHIPAKILVRTNIIKLTSHKKGTKINIQFNFFHNSNLVATENSEALFLHVRYDGKKDDSQKTHKFNTNNSQILWKKEIDIKQNQPYKYAEKANIDAPVHTNIKYAKSMGLPGVILQGTCTLAMAISMICKIELSDNFSLIHSLSAKFTGIVVPPNKIFIRLLKKDKKSLYFDVVNKKGEIIIKGGNIQLR